MTRGPGPGNKIQTRRLAYVKSMVTLAGVEPATCGLGNRRSIHLSYRATERNPIMPRWFTEVDGAEGSLELSHSSVAIAPQTCLYECENNLVCGD